MTKPTDGAVQLAEGVLCGIDDQFAPFASGAKHSPAQTQALATRIDKVAVAPAVRNLVAVLDRIQKRAKASPGDTDEDRKRDLYHIESLASQGLSRYRHLIEESGE